MKIKILLTVLCLLSNLLQAQTIAYILQLNDRESFRGSQQVIKTKATLTRFNTDFLKKTCTVFHYDSLQRRIRRYFYKRKRFLASDFMVYDSIEERIKTAIFRNKTPDGLYSGRTENYVYDSLDFLILIRDDYGGEIRIANTAQGFPYSAGHYDRNGELTSSIQEAEYLLDQNRYIVKSTSELSGENLVDTLVLDAQKWAAYPAPGEVFNDKGDPVKIPKLHVFYEYRYDKHGNWIRIKVFDFYEEKGVELKIPQAIWKRKISYKPQP